MSSREYLEGLARRYLNEAIINEKVGNRVDAAKSYRKAAEVLLTLSSSYGGNPISDIYKRLADSYLKKAQELEKESQITIGVGKIDDEQDPAEAIKPFIITKKPSVKFEDVIGLDNVKQAIIESIVYPYRRPDLFPFGWPRGILLYGPPGCGKTLIIAAVANEIDGIFMYLNAANLMSKWLGESEKKVAAIFSYARAMGKTKPVIMFLDEADAILGIYEHEIGGEVRVRNQFLQELDGLADKGEKHFVFVIAATNKPWNLDIGFLRRFQKRIYVPPPDFKARKGLFEYYCKPFKISNDVNFDMLAEFTEGYSASDIRDIVLEAYLITVRELFKSGRINDEPRAMIMNDFLEVIKVRRPSISKEMLMRYEEWAIKYGS